MLRCSLVALGGSHAGGQGPIGWAGDGAQLRCWQQGRAQTQGFILGRAMVHKLPAVPKRGVFLLCFSTFGFWLVQGKQCPGAGIQTLPGSRDPPACPPNPGGKWAPAGVWHSSAPSDRSERGGSGRQSSYGEVRGKQSPRCRPGGLQQRSCFSWAGINGGCSEAQRSPWASSKPSSKATQLQRVPGKPLHAMQSSISAP